MARIEILTLFPEAVQSVLDSSILRRAQAKGIVELAARDHRAYGLTRHRNVDDTPFGGGQGMLFRADVLEVALQAMAAQAGGRQNLKVIFPTPRGVEITHALCEKFAQWLVRAPEPAPSVPAPGAGDNPSARSLVFVCGRYEGVDERWLERWVDFEFSLGDFIVTGGELPSLAFIDAIVRLLPGVLGDARSSEQESFSHGLLEHPQYTKPREVLLGEKIVAAPEVLWAGNHLKIDEWKLRASLQLTFAFRPDLIRAHSGEGLPPWARALLMELQRRLDARD